MLEDMIRHPWFTFYMFGAIAVAIIWMIYCIKRDDEQSDIDYAKMDLLYQILERL